MIALRKGTTRRTLVVGPLAFKFALGEQGRRCNHYEANCYRTEGPANKALLCPVVACSSKGFVLVQRSAQPLTEAEKEKLINEDAFPEWDYTPFTDGSPFEFKASDWGWFKGRLVALDYSAPAL